MPGDSDFSTCRSCGASIIWATTLKGKAMPCDALPHATGEFYLFRRPAIDGQFVQAIFHKTSHKSVENAKRRGWPKYNSHFSTCPNAGQHRKSR